MLAPAEGAGDAATAVQARHWVALDRLESGDVTGFDAELGEYERAARSAKLPALAWYVPLWRAMRATIAGRADEARRLAATARAEGAQAGDANAELFWRIQISAILVLSGRSAELDLAWRHDLRTEDVRHIHPAQFEHVKRSATTASTPRRGPAKEGCARCVP